MFRGLGSVIYKEVFHVIRDPKTMFLMLLIPGMDMIIFGYAIDLEVSNISTVVYNLDGRRGKPGITGYVCQFGVFHDPGAGGIG